LLNRFTDEELEEELKRRKSLPKILSSENINLARLRKQANEYIVSIEEDGKPPKDAERYIFEEVMKTFYGSEIFKWINENNKR
jgi:hypothetical protein